MAHAWSQFPNMALVMKLVSSQPSVISDTHQPLIWCRVDMNIQCQHTMFELPQILSPKQIIVPAGWLVLACPRCKQNLLLASEPCRLNGFSKFQWLWVNWSKRKRIKYGMIFVNWFFAPKPVKYASDKRLPFSKYRYSKNIKLCIEIFKIDAFLKLLKRI